MRPGAVPDGSPSDITGYEAEDAMRIAKHEKPLRVRRAAAGCGLSLEPFAEGVAFSESKQGVKWEKLRGKKSVELECAADATVEIVAELVKGKPDIFVTSGHATQHDWQIGYSYKGGQLRCEEPPTVPGCRTCRSSSSVSTRPISNACGRTCARSWSSIGPSGGPGGSSRRLLWIPT